MKIRRMRRPEESLTTRRHQLTQQADYLHDPKVELEMQADEILDAVSELERQIRDLKPTSIPTALDAIAKEDRLNLLYNELATAQHRLKSKRGDYYVGTDSGSDLRPSFDEEVDRSSEESVPANEQATLPAETSDETGMLQPAVVSASVVHCGPLFEPTAFDPLPTKGIASMFRLDKDDAVNTAIWKKHAKSAKRQKGLLLARIEKNGGSAQSTFNPALVGDWLVDEGLKTREQVDRTLANNLPRRSAHLREAMSDLLAQ